LAVRHGEVGWVLFILFCSQQPFCGGEHIDGLVVFFYRLFGAEGYQREFAAVCLLRKDRLIPYLHKKSLINFLIFPYSATKTSLFSIWLY
jgi:hypothetical protein